MTTYAIPSFASLQVMPVMAAPINITQAIINLLAEQPRKVIDLADMLGCSPRTVDARLRRLEAIKQAHHTRVVSRKGMFYLWHAGAASRYVAPLPLEAEPEIEEEDENPRAGKFTHNLVSVYKIDTPRDPLVAALFGPARREAA